jgi:hypothetical protein
MLPWSSPRSSGSTSPKLLLGTQATAQTTLVPVGQGWWLATGMLLTAGLARTEEVVSTETPSMLVVGDIAEASLVRLGLDGRSITYRFGEIENPVRPPGDHDQSVTDLHTWLAEASPRRATMKKARDLLAALA